jgi:hypothetical protein
MRGEDNTEPPRRTSRSPSPRAKKATILPREKINLETSAMKDVVMDTNVAS